MKKNTIFAVFALLALLTVSAQQQSVYRTETEKHIVWQPGVKLTFDMFQNTQPSASDTAMMHRDNRQSLPYLGFWDVLDVPKKKSWKDLHEQTDFHLNSSPIPYNFVTFFLFDCHLFRKKTYICKQKRVRTGSVSSTDDNRSPSSLLAWPR